MFKKTCSKCRKKLDKTYDFCPFCGVSQKSNFDEEDYGILGKNDIIEREEFYMGGSFMDKMFNNAFKMAEKILEKHMKELSGEMRRANLDEQKIENELPNNLDIQFFVNGRRVFPNKKEVKEIESRPNQLKIENKVSHERMNKLLNLPREEPVSKMKRVDGRIIYELATPGVDNIEDVLINQLENSIEIKAISNKKIYSKTLNLKLPILGYKLVKGNLVLELAAK